MGQYYTNEADLIRDSFLMLDDDNVGISGSVLINSRALDSLKFDFRKLNHISELNENDQRETIEHFKIYIKGLRELNIGPFHTLHYKGRWYPSPSSNLPDPELELDSRIAFENIPSEIFDKWHPLDMMREVRKILFTGIKGANPLRIMKETVRSSAKEGKYNLVYFSADLNPYSERYMEDSEITKAEAEISVELVDDITRYPSGSIIRRPGIEKLLSPKKTLV